MVQVIRIMPDGYEHRITVPAHDIAYWVEHWLAMRDTRGVTVVSHPLELAKIAAPWRVVDPKRAE